MPYMVIPTPRLEPAIVAKFAIHLNVAKAAMTRQAASADKISSPKKASHFSIETHFDVDDMLAMICWQKTAPHRRRLRIATLCLTLFKYGVTLGKYPNIGRTMTKYQKSIFTSFVVVELSS